MGSEQNDGTSSFCPSEPKLCVNGCGFFGSPSNMNLCSKCYRDILTKEEQAASAKAAVEKSLNPNKPKIQLQQITPGVVVESGSSTSSGEAAPVDPPKPTATRCLSCNKKVGVTGFKCKCGSTFCGAHRYPESHDCEFDFKGVAREAIAKANPVVKADKVERI
ncbi:PREDICTED: zinc finger A20 and AN1 domain-containing stress-associated protein 1-like [Camelina sativa]|uniref:Zinc finger A20 and AN1 domain-containing stress-associated protein 1-like n=1 Tax=Camelina sativa TaxID=90675 RepID=A0ABM0VN30_CAMSA|nr:PREDICTED: zinc finger A20 and AN1 domain-containing stress-associated protein 1-like [Camelina sativa]